MAAASQFAGTVEAASFSGIASTSRKQTVEEEMRRSTAVLAFGNAVLASLASAQVSPGEPLRPVGADDDANGAAPEPEPAASAPKHCKFYQDCWKLTVLGA